MCQAHSENLVGSLLQCRQAGAATGEGRSDLAAQYVRLKPRQGPDVRRSLAIAGRLTVVAIAADFALEA
jgi:hypothetical protein